ncbi:MAG: hypothetical protein HC828_15670 [Blastochloris sp.]|nr:hypothetical protein [Blastochloris sp.]
MITELSATEMAHRIREGTLSPVQVVEAHISRIEQTTAAINAVVTPTFEQARQRAHEAEAARKRGELWGPLHGVPFTAKDSYDVAGVRSTGGLVSREGHFPTTDALLVARLRAAGAILLGKTNTPSNAGAYETCNPVFGLTNNPWNVTRSAGGSTGGEAAIIAAGGSPLGIGSDLAGSIRLPSAFNGIVGLRPTSNALATEGFWPPITGRIADLNALGPMARRVEDVGLGWDVLNEHDPQPIDTAVLRGQRVVYWFSDGTLPVSNAVRGGVNAAVRALEQAGMQPVANAPAGRTGAGFAYGKYWRAEEREVYDRSFGNGERWSPWGEILRALRGRARIETPTLVLWALLSSPWLAPGIDGAAWRERLRAEMRELLGAQGVAVCPVFPTTAPKHGWSSWSALFTNSYTTWVNLAGLPGLAVPVGFSGNGMPVAVQIVGNPGTERLLLAAGMAVQQALMPQWVGPKL